MHPLNDVVAHIHWVRVGRHDFNPKCIAVTGSFEWLVPTTRGFDQSRTHRLGSAAVYVVNNWLDGLAHSRAGIFFLQAMTIDIAFHDLLANRRRKIHVLNSKIAGARIVDARLESRWGQFYKRKMFADGNRLSIRRYRSE